VLRKPAYDGTYEFASRVALLLHATKTTTTQGRTALRAQIRQAPHSAASDLSETEGDQTGSVAALTAGICAPALDSVPHRPLRNLPIIRDNTRLQGTSKLSGLIL